MSSDITEMKEEQHGRGGKSKGMRKKSKYDKR
jgi:hypothetical protein